jgi:Zn-finger nucleic acid-binding protein
MMLRKNFHETSGIVVDACAAHGIWFDRGELAMALRFAATGAMAEADRHMVERAAARKRLDAFARDLRAVGPRHYIGGIGDVMVGPIDDLADISRVIPGIDPEDD